MEVTRSIGGALPQALSAGVLYSIIPPDSHERTGERKEKGDKTRRVIGWVRGRGEAGRGGGIARVWRTLEEAEGWERTAAADTADVPALPFFAVKLARVPVTPDSGVNAASEVAISAHVCGLGNPLPKSKTSDGRDSRGARF